jgi:serine/threonine-protein kinase
LISKIISYFAEYINGVIRKIDGTTGIISTIVGCGVQGFSGDGGPATNAKLAPDGLAMDDNGIMYIADYGNNRIRMVYNDKLATELVMKEKAFSIYPNPATNEITIKEC